jgi:hypothetical protein
MRGQSSQLLFRFRLLRGLPVRGGEISPPATYILRTPLSATNATRELIHALVSAQAVNLVRRRIPG